MRLTRPGALKVRLSLCTELMRVSYVHHDAPQPVLFLPDADVATALVPSFVRAVCVSEIAGARHITIYGYPLNLAGRLRELFDRGVAADERKIICAIKTDPTRGVCGIALSKPATQHRRSIVSITFHERLACNRNVNRLEFFLRSLSRCP